MSPLLRRGRGERGPRSVRLPPFLAEALNSAPPALIVPDPAASLRIAIVIPQFRRGSGGHKTIADLVRGVEARGHQVSLWLVDEEERHAGAGDGELSSLFRSFFGPVGASLRRLSDPDAFAGADVAVATGWQTVFAVLRLPRCGARAYLVQDHEPEFYATSVERSWAEWTYRQGLHAICASPWLASLVASRYGATTSSFDLGVDHDAYHPLPTHRRDDLVLFYARPTTPRRAVPLGVLALAELHRRRPAIEIALFGEARELVTPFPHRHLGVLAPDALAHAYASATVGVVLSLTNPSLVPTEMLACGLPVVDLAVPSMLSTFGTGPAGPLTLAEPEPTTLAEAIETLLDDLELRAGHTRTGLTLAATRTWPAASEQLEAGLREALAHPHA